MRANSKTQQDEIFFLHNLHMRRLEEGKFTRADARAIAALVSRNDNSNPHSFDTVVGHLMSGAKAPDDYKTERAKGAELMLKDRTRFDDLATTWTEVAMKHGDAFA